MKKQYRAWISGVLAIAVLLCMLPTVGFGVHAAGNSGTCGPNLTWTYSSATGTLRISGTGPMTIYNSHRDFPWKHLMYAVTALEVGEGVTDISEGAFDGFESLGKIVLPDSLTTIGKSAFAYCRRLSSVRMGKNLQSIEANAFEWCENLREITLPEGLTKIGYGAFYQCALRKITVPRSVKVIEERAFSCCEELTEVVLQEGLESIGVLAFQYTGVKSVTIPKTVTAIGEGPFAGSKNLQTIRVDRENPAYYAGSDGILYTKDKTTLIQVPARITGYLTIPNTVTSIGGYAFEACGGLVGASFPKGMREIGNNALIGWTGLRNLVLPEGLERIGTMAVGYCTNLRTVYIPNSVSVINRCAFYNCEQLVEISIPDNIKTLEEMAFEGCKNLYSIVIPYTLESHNGAITLSCTSLEHFLYLGYWSHWDAFRNRLPYPIMTRAVAHTHINAESLATRDSLVWKYNAGGKALYCSFCDKALRELPFEAADNPFNDVRATDYYFTPILWALEKGITTGTARDHFAPQQNCTRGQIVTFLWRAFGSPEPVGTENPFADVSEKDYYYKAVLWAVEQGITTGVSATAFAPDSSCTRGQVVTFLWRANGKEAPMQKQNPFTDVADTDYFAEAVLWALAEGITTGTSATTFAPEAPCTRGQIATFLFRGMNHSR